MKTIRTTDILLASILGYLLWGLSWIICLMLSKGLSPLDVLHTMCNEFSVTLVMTVTVGGIVVPLLFVLLLIVVLLWRLLALSSRLWGEVLYVISFSLVASVIVLLRASSMGSSMPWQGWLILWGFVGLWPALLTVLSLRGMEWLRRWANA